MQATNLIQPPTFEGATTPEGQLYAPGPDGGVPNPWDLPPAEDPTWTTGMQPTWDESSQWLAAMMNPDQTVAEVAKAEAENEEKAPAPPPAPEKEKSPVLDAIASVSRAAQKEVQPLVEALKGTAPDKKAKGLPDLLGQAQQAVGGFLGQTGQQAGAGAAQGFFQQAQSALGGILGQAQQAVGQAGTQAGTGAAQAITSAIPGAIASVSKAVQAEIGPILGKLQAEATPAAQQFIQAAGQAAAPTVAQLSHQADKSAAEGAKEGAGTEGLPSFTTIAIGVGVLGAIGAGIWYFTKEDKPAMPGFGALTKSTSTEELQKMLDRASWQGTRQGTGTPSVKWLEAAPSSRSKTYEDVGRWTKDLGFDAVKGEADSGLGTGLAVVGGAAALAVLAGMYFKGSFSSDKKASGVDGPEVWARHRGMPAVGMVAGDHWWDGGDWVPTHHAGAPPSGPINIALSLASPLHPYNLADAVGMPHEMLHLDTTAILGSSPTQQVHDDFFAGYPDGHKLGASNCDSGKLHKQGTLPTPFGNKSQAYKNGWMKGYFDGWIAETCHVPPTPGQKTASGPERIWDYYQQNVGKPAIVIQSLVPDSQVASADMGLTAAATGEGAPPTYIYRKAGDSVVTIVNTLPAAKSAGAPSSAILAGY